MSTEWEQNTDLDLRTGIRAKAENDRLDHLDASRDVAIARVRTANLGTPEGEDGEEGEEESAGFFFGEDEFGLGTDIMHGAAEGVAQTMDNANQYLQGLHDYVPPLEHMQKGLAWLSGQDHKHIEPGAMRDEMLQEIGHVIGGIRSLGEGENSLQSILPGGQTKTQAFLENWENYEPDTVTGAFAHDISQMMPMLVGFGKFMKGAGLAHRAWRGWAAGTAAGVVSFDPYAARASSTLEAWGVDSAKYLVTDPDDPLYEAMLKTVVEEATLGGVFDALGPAFKMSKYGVDHLSAKLAAYSRVNKAKVLGHSLPEKGLETVQLELTAERLSWARSRLDEAQHLRDVAESYGEHTIEVVEARRFLEWRFLHQADSEWRPVMETLSPQARARIEAAEAMSGEPGSVQAVRNVFEEMAVRDSKGSVLEQIRAVDEDAAESFSKIFGKADANNPESRQALDDMIEQLTRELEYAESSWADLRLSAEYWKVPENIRNAWDEAAEASKGNQRGGPRTHPVSEAAEREYQRRLKAAGGPAKPPVSAEPKAPRPVRNRVLATGVRVSTAEEKQIQDALLTDDFDSTAAAILGLAEDGEGSIILPDGTNWDRIASEDGGILKMMMWLADQHTARRGTKGADKSLSGAQGTNLSIQTNAETAARAKRMVDSWSDSASTDPAKFQSRINDMLPTTHDMAAKVFAIRTMEQVALHQSQILAREVASGVGTARTQLRMRAAIETAKVLNDARRGIMTDVARTLQQGRMSVDAGNLTSDQAFEFLREFGDSQRLAKKLIAAGVSSVDDIAKVTFFDKLKRSAFSWWINGLLSGMNTWIVNPLSNVFVSYARPIERMMTAAQTAKWGDMRGAVGAEFAAYRDMNAAWADAWHMAGHAIKTAAREAKFEDVKNFAMGRGVSDSVGDAFRQSREFRTFLEGESQLLPGTNANPMESRGLRSPLEDVTDKTRQLSEDNSLWTPVHAAARALNFVSGAPGRILLMEDEFAKIINYNVAGKRSIRKYLGEYEPHLTGADFEKRVDSLLEQMPNTQFRGLDASPQLTAHLKAMHDEAAEIARKLTFTNRGGQLTESITQFVGRHPSGRLALPFIRTPSNIFRYAMERTPGIGLFMREQEENLFEAMRSGNKQVAAEIRSKQILGTSLFGAAYWAATEGYITGGGPNNTEARGTWLNAYGGSQYAIHLPNGFRLRFNRYDPLGMLVGAAADIALMSGHVQEEDAMEELQAYAGIVMASFSKLIENKTYFQGAAGVMNIIRSMGTDEPTAGLERFGQDIVSSFVMPNFFAQSNRMMLDPEIKDIQTWGDAIKARTPFMSDEVPALRNIFGEIQVLPMGMSPIDFANPFIGRADQVDEVTQWLGDLELPLNMRKRFRTMLGHELPPEIRDRYILTVASRKEVRMAGLPWVGPDAVGPVTLKEHLGMVMVSARKMRLTREATIRNVQSAINVHTSAAEEQLKMVLLAEGNPVIMDIFNSGQEAAKLKGGTFNFLSISQKFLGIEEEPE